MHRTNLALLLAVALALPLDAQRPPESPEPPRAPRPAVAPRAPMPGEGPLFSERPLAYAPGFSGGGEPSVDSRHSQDPADSTYREARRALNRGEWRRAAALFVTIGTRYPNSEYRADALYWQAFALYRIGGTTELREGLTALDARRTRFPGAESQSEATALATRIRGALAARGDAAATAELAREASRGVTTCDEEDLSVRASALSALMRADPGAAQPQLERVLNRRDACSEPLRKGAVMMLGENGDAASKARLISVATSDPSVDVKVDAIGYLARMSGDDVTDLFQRIVRNDQEEERVKRAAVRALGRQSTPRAREAIRSLIERRDAPERLRLEALSTFDRGDSWGDEQVDCDNGLCSVSSTPPRAPMAPTPPTPPTPPRGSLPSDRPTASSPAVAPPTTTGPMTAPPASSSSSHANALSPDDAAWLRGLYPNFESVALKSRAASIIARATDDASVTWLMALVQKEEEPADVRASVLARLGRSLSIVQLGRLYDAADNRIVRRQIVSTLGERTEAAATDKLIEIVRTGTDPQLRRSAISALTRKNDPRTTQLLLEMIDR